MNTLPPEILIEILTNMNLNDIRVICSSNHNFYNLCQSIEFKNKIISQLNVSTFDLSDFSFNELIFYAKVLPLIRKLSIWIERDDHDNIKQEILNINDKYSYKLVNNLFSNKLIKLPPMGIDPQDEKFFYFYVNQYEKELSFFKNNKFIKSGKSQSHKILTIGKYNLFTLMPTDVILTNGGEVYTEGKIFFMDDEKAINIELVSKDSISIISSQGNFYILSFQTLSNNPILKKYSGLNHIIQHTYIDHTDIFLTSEGQVYTTNYYTSYDYDKDYIRETRYPDIIGSIQTVSSNDKRAFYYYQLELPKIIQMTLNGHLLSENRAIYQIDYNNITVKLVSEDSVLVASDTIKIEKIFSYYNQYLYMNKQGILYDSYANEFPLKNITDIIVGDYDGIEYILDDQMNLLLYNSEEEEIVKNYNLKL